MRAYRSKAALGAKFIIIPCLLAGTFVLRIPQGWAVESKSETDFGATLKKALDSYKAGDYLRAARQFEAAYVINPRPELIYNKARAYEKGLKSELAIDTFERFLALPGTTAELRTKALDSLASLRAEKVARDANEKSKEVAPPPIPAERMTSAAPQPEGVDRALEWTLIGGGAAVAATGAVFGVLALDSEQQLDDARGSGASQERLQNLSDETERNALIADVLIGVGAASALTGLVLFLVRGETSPPSISVQPSLVRSGGGLAIGGVF